MKNLKKSSLVTILILTINANVDIQTKTAQLVKHHFCMSHHVGSCLVNPLA